MLTLRTLPLLLLLGVAPLVGCGPKDGGTENVMNEDGTINPRAAFSSGVFSLQNPDKKTNEIDYQSAYDMFSQAAEAQPDFTNAHYNAGWTAERMGMDERAANHYRQAHELAPDNTEFLFAYAELLTRSNDSAAAVELYQGYVDNNASDLTVRNSLMEALAAAGRHDDAITQAREILIQDAENVSAYRNLSRIYFAQGQYAMSQLCAEKAKTMASGDAGIYNNIGVTYLVMEDLPAAVEEFKTARKLDPDHVESNLNLGYLALDSGDYALAKECFEIAVGADPGNLDAKLGLAVALRGVKDFDGASRLYDEILKADPKNQLAYFNAATLQEMYVKDYKEAKKYLENYINNNNASGLIGPEHVVYERIERINESQRVEDERQAEIAAEKKAEEERKKRQLAQLDELKTRTSALQADYDTYSGCEMMVEMGGTEMMEMVLEQALMVIEAEEADMAGDIMMFIDDLQPQIEMLKPECDGGGAAPAPAEGGEDAPAEGGEDAPVEEPPAEGGE
ncbi:MAG: tetratricopeptide repeat protein [Myxococcota bacterium]|nr:tetratricopeptide repeat protein [Myxococcota bacterium]